MIINQTYYPKLVANQVLGSGHLNDLFNYLNEQHRLSRTHLIGMGIVCGLDVTVKPDGTSVRISPGCGVTSAGYLMRWLEEEELKYGIPYEWPERIDYDFFDDPAGGDGRPQVPLWELRPRADGNNGSNGTEKAVPLSAGFLKDKVVMLVYETSETENANCTPTNCDDNGRTVDLLVKAVVIDRALLDQIRELRKLTVDGAEQYYSLLTGRVSRYNLPVLRAPRFDVLNSNPVSTRQLLEGFRSAFSKFRLGVMQDALDEIYESLAPVLGPGVPAPTGLIESMTFLYDEGNNGLLNNGRALDYNYYLDHFKGVVRAYEELRARAADLFGLCMPDERVFPKHLALHTVTDDPKVAPDHHRHYWVSSPVQNRQMDLRDEVKTLYRRLHTMLTGVRQLPKLEEIRVTPSRVAGALSDGAIPAYYPHDLHQSWNFRLGRAGRTDEILGYHAKKWSAEDATVNPLEYDLGPYNFLQVEGTLGQPVDEAVAKLRAIMRDYRLPVDLVALRTGTLTDQLEIEKFSVQFSDLEALYQDIRARLRGRMAEVAAHLYDIWILEDPKFSGPVLTPGKAKLDNWYEIVRQPALLDRLLAKQVDQPDLINQLKDKVGVMKAVAEDDRLADLVFSNPDILALAPDAADFRVDLKSAAQPVAGAVTVVARSAAAATAETTTGLTGLTSLEVKVYEPGSGGFVDLENLSAADKAKRPDRRAKVRLLAELDGSYEYQVGTLGSHYEYWTARGQNEGPTPYDRGLPSAYVEPLGLLHDLVRTVASLPETLYRSDMEAVIDQVASFQIEWRRKGRDRAKWLNELRPNESGTAPGADKLDLEEYDDQLDRVLTNGDMAALRQLLSAYLTRREKVLERQLFAGFQQRHPGLQAALGATPGGTLVLAYHGRQGNEGRRGKGAFRIAAQVWNGEKTVPRVNVSGPGVQTVTDRLGFFSSTVKELPLELQLTPPGGATVTHFIIDGEGLEKIDLNNPRKKAEDDRVDGVDEGMVVASFYLPYRIGSEAPPVYLMPAAPPEEEVPPLKIESLKQVTGSVVDAATNSHTAVAELLVSGGTGNYFFVDANGDESSLVDPKVRLINGRDYTVKDNGTGKVSFRARLTPPFLVEAAKKAVCSTDAKTVTHAYRIAGGLPPYGYINEEKKEVTLTEASVISITTKNKRGFELVAWDGYGRELTEQKVKVPAVNCPPPPAKCTLPGKDGLYDLQTSPLWAQQPPVDVDNRKVTYEGTLLQVAELTYTQERGFSQEIKKLEELNGKLKSVYSGTLNTKQFVSKTKNALKLLNDEMNKQFKTADGTPAVALAHNRFGEIDGLEIGTFRAESFRMVVTVEYQVLLNDKKIGDVARRLTYTSTQLISEKEGVNFNSFARKVQKRCDPAGKVTPVSNQKVKDVPLTAVNDVRRKSVVFGLQQVEASWPRYWMQPNGRVTGAATLTLGAAAAKATVWLEAYAVDPKTGNLYRGRWTPDDGISNPFERPALNVNLGPRNTIRFPIGGGGIR